MDHVQRDPKLLGGEPCFVGTRVPVRSLFDHLKQGNSIDQFLEQFPTVTREQVEGAFDEASKLFGSTEGEARDHGLTQAPRHMRAEQAMRHRHLDTTTWTRAAIDSALEYGDLDDWRELFAAAHRDRALAREIVTVCRAHPVPGSSALALALVKRAWPGIDADAA